MQKINFKKILTMIGTLTIATPVSLSVTACNVLDTIKPRPGEDINIQLDGEVTAFGQISEYI